MSPIQGWALNSFMNCYHNIALSGLSLGIGTWIATVMSGFRASRFYPPPKICYRRQGSNVKIAVILRKDKRPENGDDMDLLTHATRSALLAAMLAVLAILAGVAGAGGAAGCIVGTAEGGDLFVGRGRCLYAGVGAAA